MSHNLYTLNNQGADVASFHGANLGVLYIGRGESSAYTATLNSGDFFEFYDTNPVNTLGATLTQGASAGWIKSVGLAAGTYEASVSALVTGTGTGHIGVNCYNGTSYVYSLVFQCRSPSLQNGWQTPVPTSGHGMFTLSTFTTLRWLIAPAVRTGSDQGGRMSETSFLFIRRIA